MNSSPERQRAFWIAWPQVPLSLLVVYALILVFGGSIAEGLFSAFGFGPPESIRSSELLSYLRLPFVVLGSVLAGWAILMWAIVRGPLRAGAPWALPALSVPLAVWFALDTGMSFMLGHSLHAAFNVPFAAALGFPLWRLRQLFR